MKPLKSLPLIYKQGIIIALFLVCVICGIILVFGEQDKYFDVLLFILAKLVGFGFLLVAYVIGKGSLSIIYRESELNEYKHKKFD